tara:strand:+ start:68 stop:553 length:486 start_codon:yes stop_codon:yes gene_type:complete
MPELKTLTKTEQTEICRSIARAAYACLSKKTADKKRDRDGCQVDRDPFYVRLYKECSDLGILAPRGPWGVDRFSNECISVLKGFEIEYEVCMQTAHIYEECIAPLADLPPYNFALPSETLMRMHCMESFTSTLLEEDSPFANLQVRRLRGMIVKVFKNFKI